MKVERLNKENLGDVVKVIDGVKVIENNIDNLDYYVVKEDESYYLVFEMLSDDDKIAIKYINDKLSENKFLDIINYLSSILVVKNHLIIDIYDNKYMDYLDNNYRCREINVKLNDSIEAGNLREKYADIEMMSIRYMASKNEIVCNLVKQNISDEDTIFKLHELFISSGINCISFIVKEELFDYFKTLGYKLEYKAYVIKE